LIEAPRGSRRTFLADLTWLFVSMGLWAAAFHPLDLWPLAWVALVPAWVRLLDGREGRRRLGLQWMIAQYFLHAMLMGWAAVIAAPLAWFTPLLGLPFSWLTGFGLERIVARGRLPLLLFGPLVVVLGEVLRDQALLGLTWASIGYSQWRWLDLAQLSSAGRIHLVSLVVLFVNSAIATAFVRFRARAPRGACLRPLVIAGAVVIAGAGAGHLIRPRDFADGPFAVGLQPNVSQKERARVRSTGNLRIHADLLTDYFAKGSRQRPDLLVYSETSFPPTQEPEFTLDKFLATGALAAGAGGPGPAVPMRDFVLQGADQTTVLGLVRGRALGAADHGSVRDDDSDGYDETNVAWAVRGGVPTAACYAKRGLAPFGEYTPVPRGFPGREVIQGLIKRALGVLPGLNPGTAPVNFEAASPSGPRQGGLTICFEIAFPRYFRESVRLGADFHVNISNDAWFDGSSELELVDVATMFRAIETGRAVFRVSNSGISTLFSPDGTRVAAVANGEGRRTQVRGWFGGRIAVARGETGYVRFGDAVWILPAFLVALAIVVATIRAKRFLPGTRLR
jgi:apolipoprotein N-acyltransferase